MNTFFVDPIQLGEESDLDGNSDSVPPPKKLFKYSQSTSSGVGSTESSSLILKSKQTDPDKASNPTEMSESDISSENVSTFLKCLPSSVQTLELRNVLNLNKEFHLDQTLKINITKLVLKDVSANVVGAILKASQTKLDEFDLLMTDPDDCSDSEDEEKKVKIHKLLKKNQNLNLKDVQLKLNKFTAKFIDARMVASVIKSSRATLKYLDLSWIYEKKFKVSSFKLGSTRLHLTKFRCSRTPAPLAIKVITASKSSLEELDFNYIHDEHIDYEDGYLDKWWDISLKNLKKITTDYVSGKVIDLPILRSKHSLEYLLVKDMDDVYGHLSCGGLDMLAIQKNNITPDQVTDKVIPVLKACLQHSETTQLGDAIAVWLEHLFPSMEIQHSYY